MARSAAGRVIFSIFSSQGISTIEAMYWQMIYLVHGVGASSDIYSPDGRSGPKTFAQVRDGARANPSCAFHGTSGTSRRLGRHKDVDSKKKRHKDAVSTSWC